MTSALPRHPEAIACLRLVREGATEATILATMQDGAGAVRSLTYGTAGLRRTPEGLRLTTRGREALALDGVRVVRVHRVRRTVPLRSTTLAVLAALAVGPLTTEGLVSQGVRPRTVARLAQVQLVERTPDGWQLTPTGRGAAATGCVYRIDRVRVERVVGGAS